jgi:hypothetical protein
LFYIESRDGPAIPALDGTWEQTIGLDPGEPGEYLLYAVLVNDADGETLRSLAQSSGSPSVSQLPNSVGARKVSVAVRCCT